MHATIGIALRPPASRGEIPLLTGNAQRMKPFQLPSHSLAGLVHMSHVYLLHVGCHRLFHRLQNGVGGGLGVDQDAFRPPNAKQRFSRACVRQELVALQIRRHRCEAQTVLHQLRHGGGKLPGHPPWHTGQALCTA